MPNSSNVACTKNEHVCPVEIGYRFVQAYPTPILAKIMHCSEGVARNKLNPECESNKQTLLDAVALSEDLDDDRQLEAWAHRRGKGLFELPQGSCGDEEMLDLHLAMSEVAGRFAAAYHGARADGVIDEKEAAELSQILVEHMQTAANLSAEIKGQVRELKAVTK